MGQTTPGRDSSPKSWPSVDEAPPLDQGGQIARAGFGYQDEVGVSFVIEMLESPTVLKVHCETHDDLVVVRAADPDREGDETAEYVQVKSSATDKLWSVPDLCRSDNAGNGTSLYEKSLARDRCKETSAFRIVTLRDVNASLRCLTGRHRADAQDTADLRLLADEIRARCPRCTSPKGHDAEYWVQHCHWDVRHTAEEIKTASVLRFIKFGNDHGLHLLAEQAEALLEDLRSWVQRAAVAPWITESDHKIITRPTCLAWWEQQKERITTTRRIAGSSLEEKMHEAGIVPDLIALAQDLRREYSANARTPRYMEGDGGRDLELRAKSRLQGLRSRFVAGDIDATGVEFHALCSTTMETLNAEVAHNGEDHSGFLKGCMYDIADRCLFRFARPLE